MRLFLFGFLFFATNALATPNGTFNSVYYRYVPGDGIGVGRYVPQYWERQYLITISGNYYRLDEAQCTRFGRMDPNYTAYTEQGYFTSQRSGIFTSTVSFYRDDGTLRRTCTVRDGSAQPSSTEVFAMDCGNNWSWSFENSSIPAGYDFCKPW